DGIRDGHVTGVQTCALPIWSRLLPASSYPSLVPFQNEGGNPTGIRRSPFRIPVCFFICMLPPNRQSLTSPERTSFFCAGQVQTRTEERRVGREGENKRGGEK